MIGELEKLGYDIRDFGNNTIVVHGLPDETIPSQAGQKLELLIEQYKSLEGELDSDTPEQIARAASQASAQGYEKQLTELEMKELVDQLFACGNPNYTPSGKLIVRIIEQEELEKFFKP